VANKLYFKADLMLGDQEEVQVPIYRLTGVGERWLFWLPKLVPHRWLWLERKGDFIDCSLATGRNTHNRGSSTWVSAQLRSDGQWGAHVYQAITVLTARSDEHKAEIESRLEWAIHEASPEPVSVGITPINRE
jgi:hypothetical protein